MQKIFMYLILTVITLCVSFSLIAPLQVVNSELEREIVINRPYKNVLLTLSNPRVLEDFVQPSGGQIYGKQWDEFSVHVDKIQLPRPIINSSFYIRAYGHFIVEADVGLFHKATLKFLQQVHGNKEEMRIVTMLQEPDRAVQNYTTEIKLKKDEEKTKVKIYTRMTIKLRMPVFWNTEFQKTIDEINLENQFKIKHLLLDK